MQESSLGLQLRPEHHEPMYQQLFDQIAERIRVGTLPGGFRLPPTRHLAGSLGTHRNTVVRAYSLLEEAGFVTSTVGRGTFVRGEERAAPRVAPVVGEGTLPWSTLLSDAVRSEPMRRFERFARQPGSGPFINLTRMQPPPELLPHELVRRCLDHVLRTQGPRALAYGAPREGLLRLRTALATDLGRLGVPVTAEDLIVTTGSQQAIDLVGRALLNPGDVVITERATYRGALQVFGALGARVVGAASDDDGPLVPELERLRAHRPKVLYLMPNHSNPTGICISERRRHAIVAWARREHVAIVEDDYAADLGLDDAPTPPALRALDAQVIHIGSYSKRLIPALRVGYIAAPLELRPHLVALKHTADLGNSSLTQLALAEFLERGYLRAHLQRITPVYRERRDALVDALADCLADDVRWRRPSRGVTLWLELPPGVDPERAFEECARRRVLVTPGTQNAVDESAAGALRVNFCHEPPERLREAAPKVADAIEAARRAAVSGSAPVEIV